MTKSGKPRKHGLVRRILLIVLLLAVVGGIGWYAYNALKREYTTTYDTYTATTGSISNALSFSGNLALIDSMNLPERHLGLGGTWYKRMEVPPQIPPRLERWYRARELYIGKVMPEYSWAFSDRVAKEMQKDFLAMAPLYRLFRGIMEESGQPSGSAGER